MRRIAFVTVSGLLLLAGCEPSSRKPTTNDPPDVAPPHKITLMVSIKPANDGNTQLKKIDNPTNEQIQETFSSIWSDESEDNGVSWSQDGSHVITVIFRRHESSPDGLFGRFSERKEGQDKWKHLYARNVTQDLALKVMMSVNSGNDEYRTLVPWLDEDQFGDETQVE